MKELVWRWIFFIVGITIMSLGISMTIKGYLFGIGPWDVLHVGLFNHLGLSIGTWAILTGIIIVLITIISTKKIPALGTWLNILFVGSFIDMFNWLLPNPTDLLGQSIIFILGVMVMSIGIGIYVSPNLGAGPRDSLMLLIIEKTGWSLKKVRTGIEVIVAIVGWILGGPVGIGTILIAIGLGQLVHYTLPASQKYLNKISGYTLPFVKKSAEKHI
ncbi:MULTISPECIES: YitT family protein [unclassified Psychrobacillus]|uniref:YitT family protein n=1 Tax=unclassified Psychrobacillus TaxID=2636677 RepID=UPI0011A459C6